ncbi:GNAT family N-acetyltransferase [Succinivibrio dextrinosolvens]|uniref:Ribosomal protein S18 acetylase RimI n=1 Tax=Succinivibrio dextrinosolvens TaxID=83771 RepID=A0A662ZBA6_9GAMM|nr:GNAT family N-acetyltransferase [Succinivibrio dextrinosolvens]SFK30784.1 Ribosomal protein S18 acetylase RimI [Succinivibrio dextrinosolvens]
MTTDFQNKETLHMQIVDGTAYPDEVKKLIKEYYHRLGRDLSFQNIEAELDDPAVRYSPPQGELLIALENDEVLGMVVYHRLTSKRCEMKRLYLTPNARGRHLGERLVETIIDHAKASGNEEMVLDTIKPLKAAVSLYRKLGFEECEAYYDNPMEDVIYMRKKL